MERRNSKVIKFIHTLRKQIKKARIPLYSSKKSPKKYTIHQLIVLLALRKYLRKSYRVFAEILATMDSVMIEIGLENMPHFTTLQKAFARLQVFWNILRLQTKPFPREGLEILAVDSTGFSDRYSVYYRKRLENFGEVKGWKKIGIAVNAEGYAL